MNTETIVMNQRGVENNWNSHLFSDGHTCRTAFRCNLPRLTLLTDFLTTEECEQVISAARDSLTRSQVNDENATGATVSRARKSYDVSFRHGETAILKRLEDRISELCNWVPSKSTGLQVIRYLPGEFFAPHFDFIPPETLAKLGGEQRVGTVMLYLNDVIEGGETSFPDAGIRIAPQQGSALWFSYSSPRRSTMTYHAGEAPVSGEKWIAVKWLTL